MLSVQQLINDHLNRNQSFGEIPFTELLQIVHAEYMTNKQRYDMDDEGPLQSALDVVRNKFDETEERSISTFDEQYHALRNGM